MSIIRVALTGLAALALAACGAPAAAPSAPAGSGAAPPPPAAAPAASSAPTQAAAPPGPPVQVKFATQRLSSDVAIYAAVEKGYFTEQGLDVELIDINTGQGSVPALAAGQIDVGVG